LSTGGRTKLYDLVDRRIDGSSVQDNPVAKTLREQSEILAQESNYLTLKQLVDEKKKAVAKAPASFRSRRRWLISSR
jgi:hypothetical protein